MRDEDSNQDGKVGNGGICERAYARLSGGNHALFSGSERVIDDVTYKVGGIEHIYERFSVRYGAGGILVCSCPGIGV